MTPDLQENKFGVFLSYFSFPINTRRNPERYVLVLFSAEKTTLNDSQTNSNWFMNICRETSLATDEETRDSKNGLIPSKKSIVLEYMKLDCLIPSVLTLLSGAPSANITIIPWR